MSITGAFLFVLLAIVRLAGILGGEISLMMLLLFFEAGLVALLLVFRRPARLASPGWMQGIAWTSALLPILMHTPGGSSWQGLLPVPGLILTLWALASLGITFGIAPAYRGMVTTGPYRWLRHPMYAGEILSLIGTCLAAATLWNLFMLLVFTASVLWRIEREERILNCNGYPAYAAAVRYRLLPGVW